MKLKFLGLCLMTLLAAATAAAGTFPKQEDAKAQLQFAKSLKRDLRGLKGQEKREGMRQVVKAYQMVAKYFPGAVAEKTEASFRQGEILRTLKDREKAAQAFEKAVSLNGSGIFSARALLEIGHLHRKAKRFDQAIESYEKVTQDFPDLGKQNDGALIWIGKVHGSQKRHELAREIWEKVAEKSDDPLARIKAFDLIGGSFLKEKDSDSAQEILDRCQKELAAFADGDSSKAKRVRRALENMRTSAKLELLSEGEE